MRDDLVDLARRVETAEEYDEGNLLRQAINGLNLHELLPQLAVGAHLSVAASLVPAGWDWAVGADVRGFLGAPAWARVHPPHSQRSGTGNILSATPALALTAAALRARAKEAGDA